MRKSAENTYEIISGHNRVAAYRELGKEKIAAILLQEEDDSIVEASALYANLFQPDLSDYEKYLGFKKLLETTGKTQKQLALDAGVDEKSVSRWLSFGNLKEEALAIIETNPQKIGGRAVMTLASLTLEGKEKEVLHAIKAIIEGRVTQDAGVKLALQKNIEESTSLKKSESINIRMGKKIFCKMIPNKNTLRLNFQTEEQRMAVEEALKVVLSEHARELRKTIVDGE